MTPKVAPAHRLFRPVRLYEDNDMGGAPCTVRMPTKGLLV